MVAPEQANMKQHHSMERGDECIDRPAIEQDVHYRFLTLQNGLKALLVHDREGDGMHDKAAAALDVRTAFGLHLCLLCPPPLARHKPRPSWASLDSSMLGSCLPSRAGPRRQLQRSARVSRPRALPGAHAVLCQRPLP